MTYMPRLFPYLLFLLSLFFMTDSAAAVVSVRGNAVETAVYDRGETLAHDRGDLTDPFVWDCIASEASVSCGASVWESSKYLLRLSPASFGYRIRTSVGTLYCGSVHPIAIGPVSSDFYVVVYRKIVI